MTLVFYFRVSPIVYLWNVLHSGRRRNIHLNDTPHDKLTTEHNFTVELSVNMLIAVRLRVVGHKGGGLGLPRQCHNSLKRLDRA